MYSKEIIFVFTLTKQTLFPTYERNSRSCSCLTSDVYSRSDISLASADQRQTNLNCLSPVSSFITTNVHSSSSTNHTADL